MDCGWETPCHISTARDVTPAGYARVHRSIDGKTFKKLAHRDAWERKNGAIPDGHTLDHLCEQTLCMNAEHLQPVTSAANNRRRASTKLTEDAVRAIRRMPKGEIPLARVAMIYGVSEGTIRAVRSNRKLWAGVE